MNNQTWRDIVAGSKKKVEQTLCKQFFLSDPHLLLKIALASESSKVATNIGSLSKNARNLFYGDAFEQIFERFGILRWGFHAGRGDVKSLRCMLKLNRDAFNIHLFECHVKLHGLRSCSEDFQIVEETINENRLYRDYCDAKCSQSNNACIKFNTRRMKKCCTSLANKLDCPINAIAIAACHGKLEAVEMLYLSALEEIWQFGDYDKEAFGETTFFAAARNGHLNIIKRFIENGLDVEKQLTAEQHRKIPYALDTAVKYGHTDIASFLIEKGAKCTEVAINHAIEQKNENLAIRLLNRGVKCSKKTLEIAEHRRVSEMFIECILENMEIN
jgi:hypothetical protein